LSSAPHRPNLRVLWIILAATAVTAAAAAPSLASQDTAPDPTPVESPVVVRNIVFPVSGTPSFWNGWYQPRDNGTRLHLGNDIAAPKLTPALAATDATVLRSGSSDEGTAGNFVVLIDSEGWEYAYLHLNNDSPGTDDDTNPQSWALAPGIEPGAQVRAGQAVGFVGDSGNADGTQSHVHFEIRAPGGIQVDPYPSLVAAWAADIDRPCSNAPTPANQRIPLPIAQPRLVVNTRGEVVALDGAIHRGDLTGFTLDAPIVAAASTTTGAGYWLLGADGGVFSFGDAQFQGSLRSPDQALATAEDLTEVQGILELLRYNGEVRAVDIVAVNESSGYWIVLANGRSIEFGGAGRVVQPPVELAAAAVQLVPNPAGEGMWLLAADGGIFGLLGAPYFGSVPGLGVASQHSIAMMPSPAGDGYGIVDATGAIVGFGRFESRGASSERGLCSYGSIKTVVSLGAAGYQVLTETGRIRATGDVSAPRDDIEVLEAVDVLTVKWP